jgi:hypothetical protein
LNDFEAFGVIGLSKIKTKIKISKRGMQSSSFFLQEMTIIFD